MIDIKCSKCNRTFRRNASHIRHKNWMCKECYMKDLKENGRKGDYSYQHKIKHLALLYKEKRNGSL